MVFNQKDHDEKFELTVATDYNTDQFYEYDIHNVLKKSDNKYSFIVIPKIKDIKKISSSSLTQRSKYFAGNRQVSNPDYIDAQKDLQREQESLLEIEKANQTTEQQYQRNMEMLSRNPSNAMLGLNIAAKALSDTGLESAKKRVRKAQNDLMNTPMYIDEPVYNNYTFTIQKVTLGKSLSAYIIMFNMFTNKFDLYMYEYSDEKIFNIPNGINPDDPDFREANFDSTHTMESFARNSVNIHLTESFFNNSKLQVLNKDISDQQILDMIQNR